MCVVHKNTHAHTHLLDTLLPGTSEEAEPVTDRNRGGKEMLYVCVFLQTAEKNASMSKSTVFP